MEHLQHLRQTTEKTVHKFIHIYLQLKTIGIQEWIERYKHDIYHFYCIARCDLCTSEYQLPKQRLLFQDHIDKLFEVPDRSKGGLDVIALLPRDVSVDDIDLEIADCLLQYCCDELYWHCCLHVTGISLRQFLNEHKEEIYHLVTDCKPPDTSITTEQWTMLFETTHMKGRNNNFQEIVARPKIQLSDLNEEGGSLSRILLKRFCPLKRALTRLMYYGRRIYTYESTEDTYFELKDKIKKYSDDLLNLIDMLSQKNTKGRLVTSKVQPLILGKGKLKSRDTRYTTDDRTNNTVNIQNQPIITTHLTKNNEGTSIMIRNSAENIKSQQSASVNSAKNNIKSTVITKSVENIESQFISTTNFTEKSYQSKDHFHINHKASKNKVQALKDLQRKKPRTVLQPRSFPRVISSDIVLNTNIWKAEDRLMTFIHWPPNIRYWPKSLAEVGFVYTGTDSIVQCFKCKIQTSVGSWSHYENLAQAHARLNPDCSFVVENGWKQSRNAMQFVNTEDEVRRHNVIMNDDRGFESNSIKVDLRNKSDGLAPSKDIDIDCRLECHNKSIAMQQETQSYNNKNYTDLLTNLHYRSDNVFCPEETNLINKQKSATFHLTMDTLENRRPNQSNGMNDLLNFTWNTTDSISPDCVSDNITVNTEQAKYETDRKNNIEKFKTNSSDISQDNFGAVTEDVVDRSQQSQVIQYQNSRHPIAHPFGVAHNVMYKYPQFQTHLQRLKSYRNWMFTDKQKPEMLSAAGYFYTGEEDIVRCFCCDLGLAEWDITDDAWVEHARHSPSCWFLKNEKGEEFVNDIQMKWRKTYNPKHPAFEDKKSRLATFEGVWRSDVEQTPEILTDAGFYYTGEEDVVRCHYCDGGLRHWDTGDIPWEEHARWFPFCKFVIKIKGREYIDSIRQKYEDIEREQELNIQTEESFSAHPFLKQLEDLSFKSEDIKSAMRHFWQTKGHTHFDLEDLVDTIISKEQESESRPTITAQSIQKEENSREIDPGKLREINRQLKERMLCFRCKINEITMLFPNCGHRITCETCAYQLDYCPHCNKKITKRMKTFLS